MQRRKAYRMILLIAFFSIRPALAQQEFTPLPLDQLNRDSLNRVILQKENGHDYKSLAGIYGSMYNYFLYSSFREAAILYADKAEEYSLKTGDSAKYYFIQLQLGEFNTSSDSALAVAYYKRALHHYVRTSNYALQGNALGGLAYLYGLYKDTVKLLHYLNDADKVVSIAKDTFNMMGANDKRIHILMHNNKLDSAIRLLQMNLRLIEQAQHIGNSESVRLFWKGLQLNLLADCYYRKKLYTQAIQTLQQALAYDKQTSLFDAQNSIRYHLLVNSFINTNDKDSAIKYLDYFFNQTIETYNNINPEKLKEITEKYQSEKRQRAIEQLQQEKALQQLAAATQRKLNMAFICILITILIAVYFIIRNMQQKRALQLTLERQQAALAKKQAIETERYRISAELHDDLGSGLSTIRLLSEMMRTTSGNGMEQQLGKISESSRELVQKINEIVWALNVNNDNVQSLLAYIRQYAAKTFDDVGIDCKIETSEFVPDIAISGNERRNIFLMVKECIHNIIKHSRATRVHIRISISENLCITIHDNGIGFCNTENSGYHFGVNNLKQRARELNGSIEWQLNAGTSVQIQVSINSLSHKSIIA